MAAAVFVALIPLSACSKAEQGTSEDYEAPPCWVYKGLDEEEIKRMEAWCNEYAVCGDKDGQDCSAPAETMEP